MPTILAETAEMIKAATEVNLTHGGSFQVCTRERQDKHNCLYYLNNENILNNFARELKDELCEPNTIVDKTLIGRARDGYIILSYKGCYILVMIQKDYAMVITNSFTVKVLVFRNLEQAEDTMDYYEADESDEDW